ncbi:adenylate/guanylate cyclase domain-containing protein [Vineibacter terrae]|uniref:Adenylate/guanylate cyclase domain-containing protein n=1 Tax=Vineibacter terrae TaxID=2586908 RepID=A0A5C8PE62_9HYPH|nr:adenylate/guanylate cyclase domain-containing protein [Vineibacter terrae]TXL72079.1 adenylate/guanylate cyclase domain-containing protein [Vineibacter terrae]
MIGQIRLYSGLVLFGYAALHLSNHVLLLGPLRLANDVLAAVAAFWHSPPGTVVLYGALLAHVALALWSFVRRRHLRLVRSEWLQLVLGLAILPVGITHFVANRGSAELHDVPPNYLWVLLSVGDSWLGALQQMGLALIVWIHGCIGIHAWLRLKPSYRRWLPSLFGFAVALPVLALAGTLAGARQVSELAADPERLREMLQALGITAEVSQELYRLSNLLKMIAGAILVAALAARPLRDLWERRHGVVRIRYSADRVVVVPAGPSLLEISRGAGVPHPGVCGGRGRCSTCRVRIGGPDRARLPEPTTVEAKVLARIGAPPNVRLACQIHPPAGDYHVTPLMSPSVGPSDAWRRSSGHGSERFIAVLFADIRGFTALSEGRLPFDVVFVVNRYFRAMGGAIESAGGHVDKFIGDGVMALFGIDGDPQRAAQQALDAARRMSLALKDLNDTLSADLDLRLRIGIGVHAGPAIVGEMGYGQALSLTAIGDMVNTASRLESMTKELACELVVSHDLLERAGVMLDDVPRHEIDVRGRRGKLVVYAIADAATLAAAPSRAADPAGGKTVVTPAPA